MPDAELSDSERPVRTLIDPKSFSLSSAGVGGMSSVLLVVELGGGMWGMKSGGIAVDWCAAILLLVELSRSKRAGPGDCTRAEMVDTAGEWGTGVDTADGVLCEWECDCAIAASCRWCCCVGWTVPSSARSNTTMEQYPSELESNRACPSGDLTSTIRLLVMQQTHQATSVNPA